MHRHPPSSSPNKTKIYILIAFLALALVFLTAEVWILHHQQKSTDKSGQSVQQQEQDFNGLAKLLDERAKLVSFNEQLKLKLSQLESNQQQQSQQQQQDLQTTKSSSASTKPWLIIGIPTVPRTLTQNEPQTPVLLRTLESLLNQISKPSFMMSNGNPLVKVVVLNQRPGAHPAFDEAKRKYAENESSDSLDHKKGWIEFHENTEPYNDPPYPEASSIDPEFANKNQQAPTERVKRQTLDVASLLKIVEGRSQYFLFYEDDFHFCDNAILHLMNMIERANLNYGTNLWSAMRCSFGLAGIVMQNGVLSSSWEKSNHESDPNKLPLSLLSLKNEKGADQEKDQKPHPDVAILRRYFLRHFSRRPPDHLVVEFYAAESKFSKQYFSLLPPSQSSFEKNNKKNPTQNRKRKLIRNVAAYRYNILRHDGVKSTLRDDEGWSMPGCFEELVVPQVFEVEAWNAHECPDSDLWPCDSEQQRRNGQKGEEKRRGVGFTSFVRNAKIEKRDA